MNIRQVEENALKCSGVHSYIQAGHRCSSLIKLYLTNDSELKYADSRVRDI